MGTHMIGLQLLRAILRHFRNLRFQGLLANHQAQTNMGPKIDVFRGLSCVDTPA